jgi:ATP-dependent helicase/nuclease subunit A
MTRMAIDPVDQQARDAALDTSTSVIVQAPAGSGKTDLLTKRFLKLLAEVDAPEQILAITFTRAATAEMRQRILESLEKARTDAKPGEAEPHSMLFLARRALRHAEHLGWKLLEQPHRLQIETVDSFCRRIAQKAPLLSRLGGMLNPTEDASALYRLAARRTLEGIGSTNRELQEAVSALLEARDNNLADCQELLMKMLARRDQWSREFVLAPQGYFSDVELRKKLERPMEQEILRSIRRVHSLLSNYDGLDELFRLARYACSNLEESSDIWPLRDLAGLPALDILSHAEWEALPCFLLSAKNEWRKRATKAEGFPVGTREPGHKNNEKFLKLIRELRVIPGLLDAMCELRSLPPARFTDAQWNLLQQLFRTLRYASGELRVVFAEQNQVDFVELGMAAREVLHYQAEEGAVPSDVALAAGERIRHLLFDEFQDTSRSQHQLLEQLIATWEAHGNQADDQRTCFIVGDPMQSIYAFRQAEVELFQQVQRSGFHTQSSQLIPESVRLHQNFRSGPRLVEQMNEVFSAIFGRNSVVPFVEATPMEQNFGGGRYTVHATFYTKNDQEERNTARAHQRRKIIRIVQSHLVEIEKAQTIGREYRVAILARAGKHLFELAQDMRNAQIPFRAVDMEQLEERQEILDLTSLVRALVDPMDRIAWLSILRAPWCGLTLKDLYLLCGEDEEAYKGKSIGELLVMHLPRLSEDGQERVNRLWRVMEQAREARFSSPSLSFGSRIERIWHSLGAEACVDRSGLENAEMFFSMLDQLPNGELSVVSGEMEERLANLCAQPDPQVSERCGIQLMTIHKSKGLGFDVVLVPGLERPTAGNKQELLLWLERATPSAKLEDEPTEILLAPIQQKGSDDEPLLQWVKRQIAARDAEERKRLLYVACTRARRELHLFGAVEVEEEVGVRPPKAGTLLATAWPALEMEFQRQFAALANGDFEYPESNQSIIDGGAQAFGPRRLPAGFTVEARRKNVSIIATYELDREQRPLFDRPEAGIRPRLFGTLVHELLDRTAKQLASHTLEEVRSSLNHWRVEGVTSLRRSGLAFREAERIAEEVIASLRQTLDNAEAQWILMPHRESASEVKWTGLIDDRIQTVQVDRIFRAGVEVGSRDGDVWWIFDYKTTEPVSISIEDFLQQQQLEYKDQLATYARVLRLMHGESIQIHAGLYYPLLCKLHWWPL